MHQLEAAYNSYISAMEHSKVIKTNARRVFGAHLRATRTELGMSSEGTRRQDRGNWQLDKPD